MLEFIGKLVLAVLLWAAIYLPVAYVSERYSPVVGVGGVILVLTVLAWFL